MLTAFLKNALVCIIKNKLHRDCLPIKNALVYNTCLLNATALFNAVCLYNACLFLFVYFVHVFCIVIIYTNAFVFMLCLWVIVTYTSIII